jgi:hypothetical protein
MANITAYYGTAASCTRYSLDPIDWQDAQTRPDKAKWSLTPQSGTITNDIPPPFAPVTSTNINAWAPGYPNVLGYGGWAKGMAG